MNRNIDQQGAIVRGFPHLRLIRRAIGDLHRRFPGQRLLKDRFPLSLGRDVVRSAVEGAPDWAANQTADEIVKHFGLRAATTLVVFREDLTSPARIWRETDGTYSIEVHAKYRVDRADLAGILAHEVAHAYLEAIGLQYADTQENELLTDTTAVYLGAGWPLLNAYRRTITETHAVHEVSVQRRREEKLGYLTPDEFGYVLARRCVVTGENPESCLGDGLGVQLYRDGRRRVGRERRRPPLVGAGMWCWMAYHRGLRRAMHPAWSGWYIECGKFAFDCTHTPRVVFECPVCSQLLRLPVAIGRIEATCKVCSVQFQCRT